MDFEEKWQDAMLFEDATIHQAVKNLNDSGLQIALVVSADRTLQGTITDGDIRRGLLRGLSLDESIQKILNRDPFIVPIHILRESVLQMMEANRIDQIPIVDAERRVVGLHLWHPLKKQIFRSNLLIIMVGGLGSRLKPHTQYCPKPLLPVAGKPMLEHIIERAVMEGIRHIVLAIGHLGHMIEAYFGNGALWNIQIDYIRESLPLGTAGALGLLDLKPSMPFIVTNGDVLTEVRYGELLDFHLKNRAAATMAIRHHEWQHPFGVVRSKGLDIIGFEEKPIYRTNVNAGIYVIEPKVLHWLKKDEHCDMPAFFARLAIQGERTIVYPMHESWVDVGCPDDYEQAEQMFSVERHDA